MSLIKVHVIGRTDPSQRNNKNNYIIVLKLDSGVDPGQGSGHEWS
jgi:hypothetical protein